MACRSATAARHGTKAKSAARAAASAASDTAGGVSINNRSAPPFQHYEWSEIDPDAPTDPNDPDYDYSRAPDPERPVETFLVTDGPNAGKAVQGQRNRSSGGYGVGVERDWEAERIERERRYAEYLATRRPLFRRYAGHLDGDVDLVGLLTEEPMLWQLASITARGLSGAANDALYVVFGVEHDPDESWFERAHRLSAKVDELAKTDAGTVIRLILLACAAHHLDRSRHDDDGDFLVELLENAGIDPAAVPPDPVPDPDADAEGVDEPAA